MREVLGAGRGVQAGEVETPAIRIAAEAGRETRRGAESDEESDGCDGAQNKISARGYATHKLTKPQGFISRPPLLTTNKVFRISPQQTADEFGDWRLEEGRVLFDRDSKIRI